MRGKSFFMHTAKAVKPRCYETTVDFHFTRNAEGQLIAVDNTTGRPIGQIVTMGETIAARNPLDSLLSWGSRAVRCATV